MCSSRTSRLGRWIARDTGSRSCTRSTRGSSWRRSPVSVRPARIAPFGVFRAADGFLVVAAGNDPTFERLCNALDLPVRADEARFATNAARCAHHDALRLVLEARLGGAPVGHWLEVLRAAGIPCGPMNDVGAVMRDRQVQARAMLLELATPGGGSLRVAGNPVKFTGDAPAAPRPAPRLDEHRTALLRELGFR